MSVKAVQHCFFKLKIAYYFFKVQKTIFVLQDLEKDQKYQNLNHT